MLCFLGNITFIAFVPIDTVNLKFTYFITEQAKQMKTKNIIFTSCLILSTNVSANIVNVDISASWTPANFTVTNAADASFDSNNPEFDGKVFGVAPTVGTTTINLQVNTDSYMSFAAGSSYTSPTGSNYTLAHDWYGYTDVTLVGGTHSYGSATWDTSGILTGLVGTDGNLASLWTDADIETTDPTRASFRMFGSGDGLTADVFVGSRTLSNIGSQFLLWEYYDGEEIRVDGYTVKVNPVPVPAAIWLFVSGLVGFVGFGRRA